MKIKANSPATGKNGLDKQNTNKKSEQLDVYRSDATEQTLTTNGKTKWGISKAKLDSLISKCWRGRCYGSGKQPYYNARQIEYIFGKTQAWIDTFIRGKCPRVDKYGDRVEKKEAFNRIYGIRLAKLFRQVCSKSKCRNI